MTSLADKNADPRVQVADYRVQGRSVVKDAMATGMTYEEAMQAFGDMDPASNPTRTGTQASSGGGRWSTSATTASSTTPYDNNCADVTGDAGHATSHACVIRYLDYVSGGDWYFSHKEKVSARNNDWWYRLDTANVWYVYSSGNTLVDWSPGATMPIGQCGTVSVGVTDPKAGFNIGYSGTVCPDKMSPVFTNSNLGFGAQWNGSSSDYRQAIATSVVHNPPGIVANTTVRTYIHWS